MPGRPDKEAKKQALQRWKAGQRADAQARLPMPDARMEAMFDMLDVELPIRGCDHSLRLVRGWLIANGLPVEPVLEWARENGSYCGCEVLANAEEAWHHARGDTNW
jgi:hypothetical protein